MVRAFPSHVNCTRVLLDSGQSYDDVSDYDSEATSSNDSIPTITLSNGVEMPLLGLGKQTRAHYYEQG
ncbi:unnamed protein product, partial [Strongylus vulgaris]